VLFVLLAPCLEVGAALLPLLGAQRLPAHWGLPVRLQCDPDGRRHRRPRLMPCRTFIMAYRSPIPIAGWRMAPIPRCMIGASCRTIGPGRILTVENRTGEPGRAGADPC
jgi:hypothetical protein